MLSVPTNKIQRGFSTSAISYDANSGLHRQIADKLLSQAVNIPVARAVLDVGCGTGYLTRRLKEIFPQSKVVGLDFSQRMLDLAKLKNNDITWVLGDGHQLPFVDASFDLLISNLAYQWSPDLSMAFGEARRVIPPGGVMVCTLFGYNTCQELFRSLNEAKGGSLLFSRLPDALKVKEALTLAGFKDPLVKCEQIKIEFKDMPELTAWLKSIGANNLPREGYIGRDLLDRAAAIYRERFAYLNGVQATFEVIRIYVQK